MAIKRLGYDARGRPIWRVDWYDHGRRRYERMVGERYVAEQFLADRKGEKINAAAGLASPASDLKAAVKDYLATAEHSNRESYVRNLRRTLEALTKMHRHASVGAVTHAWLLAWQRKRAGKVSRRTVNRELSEIRTFLEWEVNAGRLADNPAARVKPLLVDKKPVRWFRPAEYALIWKAAKPPVRDLLDAYLCTGLRWRELQRIAMDSGGLQVSGRKGRDVLRQPLSVGVRELIARHGASGARQWPFLATISNRIAHLCAKVGLPRAGVHALRHTCATWALACGADIYRLRQHLGHKSVTQTEGYEGEARGWSWRLEARSLPKRTRRLWRSTLGIMGVSISYPSATPKALESVAERSGARFSQRRTG